MEDTFRDIVAALQNGKTAEARAACAGFLAANPNHAVALQLMGDVAAASSDHAAAVEWWERAVGKGNASPKLQHDLALALVRVGRVKDAIPRFLQFSAMAPNSFTGAMNLARALVEEKRYVEAEGMGRRAMGLRPKSIEAKCVIAEALRGQGRFQSALELILEVIKLGPRGPEYIMSAAAGLYENMGQVAEATRWHREAARAAPTAAPLHSNYLFSLRYLAEEADPGEVHREHTFWATRVAAPLYRAMGEPPNDADPDRKLRIGYLCADFRRHSNSNGIEPLITHHNGSEFEVVCYSDSRQVDQVTKRFQSHAHEWVGVAGLTDAEVARKIRDDGIDILVDHTGHMGGNRMLVFARRPAPVQVSVPGYPGTTGLQTIDAFFTDRHQDPPGQTEHFYSEPLVRFSGSPRCYQPIDEVPEPSGLAADAAGGRVTFAVVQRPSKLTDRMLGLWSKVLGAALHSRLVLLLGESSSADLERVFKARLSAQGIEMNRVALLGRRPLSAYIEMYQTVDVVLDTQPYAGCTTTMDALWMGVPVVTMAGKTYATRVGVSILAQLGLDREWVAENDQQYVEIAVKAASDLPRLRELRTSLRQRMRASPLLDAKRVTAEFEAACRTLWKAWCGKRSSAEVGV